jgi:nitroreductase/NAD-dependent dihydropyrimidine dehydrogenase PreA subunit
MSLFTINEEKCKRDGFCVKECPAQIITLAKDGSLPSIAENMEEYCINCGHCVAICPHDALTLKTMPLDQCLKEDNKLHPGPQQIKQFLMARRSIRNYKKDRVSHELLESLLDTARYAPTGSNKQQVYWLVFENPSEVHRLAALVIDFMRLILPETQDEYLSKRMNRIISAWEQGKDRILREAPHLVVVHSPADISYALVDSTIALTYLELYAYSLGLGTCWAGYFTMAANLHAPLSEALKMPAGHVCHGAVMLGYPQYKYRRIPLRNAPLVTWR